MRGFLVGRKAEVGKIQHFEIQYKIVNNFLARSGATSRIDLNLNKRNYFLNAFSTRGESGFKLLVSTVAGAGREELVSGPSTAGSEALLQARNSRMAAAITVKCFIVGI